MAVEREQSPRWPCQPASVAGGWGAACKRGRGETGRICDLPHNVRPVSRAYDPTIGLMAGRAERGNSNGRSSKRRTLAVAPKIGELEGRDA